MGKLFGLCLRQVGLVLWDKWPAEYGWNPGPLTAEQGYVKLALREFRYHPNPRGRFMVRDLDPDDEPWEWSTVGAERWTDYDIPMPNGDFDVTFDPNGAPGTTGTVRYLEGFGLPAQQTVSTGDEQYLHGDLIRSTMMTTDDSGDAVSSVAYTAFGELVTGYSELDTRYQYAGGWGYESDLLVLESAPGTAPITLQHVGFRWYQPDIGRFVQRDPLGVLGGSNTYAYAGNDPIAGVDPVGLDVIWVQKLGWCHSYICVEDCEGGWVEIHYFRRGSPGLVGPGQVSITPVVGGPPAGWRIPTCVSEDLDILDTARRYQQNPPAFCVPISCCCTLNAGLIAGSDGPSPIPQPSFCFVAGTTVETCNGPCPIEQVVTGQCVSEGLPSAGQVDSLVLAVHRGTTRSVVKLRLKSDVITCTPEHPFYVLTKGWTRAADIRSGDALATLDGGSVTVHQVDRQTLPNPVAVYTLEVSGEHTFCVGRAKLIVHNKVIHY